MSANKRKNEVGLSKGSPAVKKNKSAVENDDIVLSNVVFGDSNKTKTNGVQNASNGKSNNPKTPIKDLKMTEKSESSSSSDSSSSEEEKVITKVDVKKATSTPSKTQQTASTKSTPQPPAKKADSSSESSSESDEEVKDKSAPLPQKNTPKTSVVSKAQPPVKSAAQNGSSKKADSSSSSESSSESEAETVPAKKAQPPTKSAVATKPVSNNSTKKDDSESSSSSSEDEKEAPVPKTVPSKIVSKPAPLKVATQTKNKDSDSSDSSSSESEEETKPVVSIVPTKTSQPTPATKAVESSDSSSEEEEKVEAPASKKSQVTKKAQETKPVKKSSNASAETIQYREENNITFEDQHRGEEFPPIQNFKEAVSTFPSDLMKVTEKFTKPTPIQAQSWPIARSGRDIIAIAETGSGKTLSFTLPILAQILSKSKKGGEKRTPIMLVLAPTRELAMQTADVCEAAGATCGLKTLCAYGGAPRDGNVRALKSGIDLLIATPGRLIDLIDDGVAILDKVNHLVLDEADRMLDMGFEPAIRKIVAAVPKTRQTLMFSATWPSSIQSLASEFLQEPVKVTIGKNAAKEDGGPQANHRVTQIVEVMTYRDKERRLEELLHKLHKSRKNRILVFALYKKEAERIEQTLRRKGWKVQGIHGDKSQALRSKAIESFRSGEEPLLVATDVAARGLDIPDVEYVINYTFPLTIEDYVHRIGRTGRAGKTGTAYTFFTDDDKSHAGELQQVLREANQNIPQELLNYGSHIKKKEHALYGAHFKKIDGNQKATRITFDE